MQAKKKKKKRGRSVLHKLEEGREVRSSVNSDAEDFSLLLLLTCPHALRTPNLNKSLLLKVACDFCLQGSL